MTVRFERDPKRPGNLNVYIDGKWSHGTPVECLDGEIAICKERGEDYEIPAETVPCDGCGREIPVESMEVQR